MENNNKFCQITILLLGLILLAACKQSPAPAPLLDAASPPSAPTWYTRQSFDAPGYWLGYGDAITLAQAKAMARADLSASFRAQVRSRIRIDRNLEGNALEQQAKSRIEQFSSAQFTDLKTLKSEQHSGRYFVVLGFDHRPLHQRLVSLLSRVPGDSRQSQQLPNDSRLYQQLEQTLGRVPPLQLYHEHGRYLLAAGGVSEAVRDEEIALLLPRPVSADIDFSLNPDQAVYAPETLFTVTMRPHQSGYLSYLQVFANGATVRLLANRRVEDGEQLSYPDPRLYDGLMTELLEDASSTTVQHLAVLCPNARDLSSLDDISSRAYEHYQSFQLGEWNRLFGDCAGQWLAQSIRR